MAPSGFVTVLTMLWASPLRTPGGSGLVVVVVAPGLESARHLSGRRWRDLLSSPGHPDLRALGPCRTDRLLIGAQKPVYAVWPELVKR